MFSLVKNLSKHTIIYGTGDLLSKGLGFILIPLYTHYLTSAQYGTLELLDLTVYIVGLLITMGIAQSVVRYYYDTDEEEQRHKVISVALITIWVLGAIVLTGLIFGSREISKIVFDSSEYFRLFNIVFITMVINLSNEIPMTVIRIEQKSILYTSISLTRLVISLSLNILFIVHFRMGIEGILVAGLVSNGVTGIFLVAYMLRRIRLTFSFDLLKSMLGYSFPLVWAWAGAFVLHFGDRFLLQRLSTLSAVGIYALAYKFGMMANMLVLGPFNLTWSPKRFEVVKEPDAPRTFSHIFTYISLVQIWAGLGVAVLIKDALKIISEPEYHSAYMYVPVLILGHYFYGSFAYLQFGPFLKKKTKYLGGLAVVLAGVNVGLNLLLIPVLGIWGATLTTLVSYFLMVALLYPIAQKLYYIPFQFGRLLKLLGTAAALYFIAHFINPPSLTLALIIKFLIGLSYPLVLYVLRFYTAQERSKLKDIASSVFCTTKKRLFGVRNDSCMKEPEDKPV